MFFHARMLPSTDRQEGVWAMAANQVSEGKKNTMQSPSWACCTCCKLTVPCCQSTSPGILGALLPQLAHGSQSGLPSINRTAGLQGLA